MTLATAVHQAGPGCLQVGEEVHMTAHESPGATAPAEVARLFDLMADGEAAAATLEQTVRVIQDSRRAAATLATLPARDLRAGIVYRATTRAGRVR